MNKTEEKVQPRPWYVALVAGMASYIDSAAIIGLGTTLVIYQTALGLTGPQIGFLSGTLTICIAIGALFGGRLGDKYGRKAVFSVPMVLIALGALFVIFSTAVPFIAFGVVLIGLGTGADLPVSLATIAEDSPTGTSGKYVSFSNVLWLIGIVVTQLLAVVVGDMGRVGGQILIGHFGLVALILLFLRMRIPESSDWRQSRADGTAKEDGKIGFSALLRGPYLLPFLGLLGFYSLTNLAANTQGQFGNYIWANVVDQSVSFTAGMSLISQITWFVWAFCFMAIADNPRLRMVLFVGAGTVGVIGQLIPVFAGFSTATMIISQLAFGLFVGFSFEGIMKVWTQESFPTTVRATAQGTIIAFARVIAALLATVTPMLLAASPQTMYTILAVVMTLGMLIAFLVFRKSKSNYLLGPDGEQSVAVEGK